MKSISFSNHGVSSGIRNKKELESFFISVFETEKTRFENISFIFCRDNYLLKLNQKYLLHDTYTDILTFTLSGLGLPIISEIYISVQRVRENASLLGLDYFDELLRVMIHGILHLCGYSDHAPSEKKQMRKKEDHYLAIFSST